MGVFLSAGRVMVPSGEPISGYGAGRAQGPAPWTGAEKTVFGCLQKGSGPVICRPGS
jgi:hypothetical protein